MGENDDVWKTKIHIFQFHIITEYFKTTVYTSDNTELDGDMSQKVHAKTCYVATKSAKTLPLFISMEKDSPNI